MVKIGGATLEEVSPYFHLPIEAAAKELGVCSSALKRRCRRLGIKRWPFRKVRSMSMSMARNMEDLCGAGAAGVMPSFLQPQAATRLAAQVAATSLVQRKNRNPRPPTLQLPQSSQCASPDQIGEAPPSSSVLKGLSISPPIQVPPGDFSDQTPCVLAEVQGSHHESIVWETQSVKAEEFDFCSQAAPPHVQPKPRGVRPSAPLQHLTCPPPFQAVSALSSLDVTLIDIPSFFSPAAGRLLSGRPKTPQSRSLTILSPLPNSFQNASNSMNSVIHQFNSGLAGTAYSPRVFLSPRVFGEEIFSRNSYVGTRGREEAVGDSLMSPQTQSMLRGFGLLDTPTTQGHDYRHSHHTAGGWQEAMDNASWGASVALELNAHAPQLSPSSRDLLALISASPLSSPPHLFSLEPDNEDQHPVQSFTELLTMEVDMHPAANQPSSSLLQHPTSPLEPQSPFSWLKISAANEFKEEDPFESVLLSPGSWQWQAQTQEAESELLDPSQRSLFLWPPGSPLGLHVNIRPMRQQNDGTVVEGGSSGPPLPSSSSCTLTPHWIGRV